MSDKKQLLEEQNIRRFMHLAGQGDQLTESFFDRQQLDEMPVPDEEGEVLPEPEGELEPELDAGPVADEEVVKDLVDAIADAITAETGIDVSVTGEEGGDELPMEEPPLGEPEGELPLDLGDEEVPMQESASDEIDEDLNAADVEVNEAGKDESDEDALVAEIARRVARRLLRESAKK